MNPHRLPVEVEKTSFFMPYAPLIRVPAGGELLFISGATALPLYHDHPHRHEQLDPPSDVREQTRLVMESLSRCLAAGGATWKDIVRTDLFVTDWRTRTRSARSWARISTATSRRVPSSRSIG